MISYIQSQQYSSNSNEHAKQLFQLCSMCLESSFKIKQSSCSAYLKACQGSFSSVWSWINIYLTIHICYQSYIFEGIKGKEKLNCQTGPYHTGHMHWPSADLLKVSQENQICFRLKFFAGYSLWGYPLISTARDREKTVPGFIRATQLQQWEN